MTVEERSRFIETTGRYAHLYARIAVALPPDLAEEARELRAAHLALRTTVLHAIDEFDEAMLNHTAELERENHRTR